MEFNIKMSDLLRKQKLLFYAKFLNGTKTEFRGGEKRQNI